MSNQQTTFQTFHEGPSEVTLAPSEATLCPSEAGLLPQQQRPRKSKAIRAKAKNIFKGIADSYLADAQASSMTTGQVFTPLRTQTPRSSS